MHGDWLDRWANGRTGWHEADGNSGLKAHWPLTGNGTRVLVPLCGKSPDLLWLAERGHAVVGVELADIAIREFFADNELDYTVAKEGPLDRYTTPGLPLTLYCGDYFEFEAPVFDGLYDRGALVAIPKEIRPRYVEHTKKLLRTDAARLIVTLEYDQEIVQGPPFSVSRIELTRYWDDLQRVEEKDDIETCPPKFRAAGLEEIKEVFWLGKSG